MEGEFSGKVSSGGGEEELGHSLEPKKIEAQTFSFYPWEQRAGSQRKQEEGPFAVTALIPKYCGKDRRKMFLPRPFWA